MNRFEWFKEIFSFSKSEFRGIILLILIIIILLSLKAVLFRKLDSYNLHSFNSMDTDSIDDPSAYLHYPSNPDYKSSHDDVSLQSVDPNTASFRDLVNIGVPAFAARNLIKYRENGAIYETTDDLLKVYGFDSSLLLAVKNYFLFNPDSRMYEQTLSARAGIKSIELNCADSVMLESLPGIGPVLSARIIKYRKLLGGFYSHKQLAEVYGIDDSLFTTLSKYIEIDTFLIKKMNLNSSTQDEFEKHPYITKYQAKALMSYRRLMGPFSSVEQVLENYLVPEETYYRVLPYLTLN